jgi:hypothetical protein
MCYFVANFGAQNWKVEKLDSRSANKYGVRKRNYAQKKLIERVTRKL